jgi:tetratricopeptide (TPR) repeat protein
MTVSTGGMRLAVVTALSRSPSARGQSIDSLVRRFAAMTPTANRAQALLALGSVEGALGRQIAARQIGDTLAAMIPGPGGQNFQQYVSIMPIIGGFADSTMLVRLLGRLDSAQAAAPANAPFVAYYRAMIALDQGQPEKAGSILQPVLAQLNATTPDFLRGGLIGLDGLRMIASGDVVHGAARADSGMRIVGGFANPVFSGAVSLRLALSLASQPATRAAGIARLHDGFTDRVEFLPIVQYDLAKAYDAAGDRASAIASYGQFLRLWDHPDSNFQARVRNARDALQRLTAEGAK